ncbi:hypothetical protein LINPERPRIM_LOCUS18310 [Linum perenne]
MALLSVGRRHLFQLGVQLCHLEHRVLANDVVDELHPTVIADRPWHVMGQSSLEENQHSPNE